MKKFTVPFMFFLFILSKQVIGKIDDSENEALASCRNQPFSAVVQTCITDLASKKKSIYEEVFKEFVTGVKASRKDFFNYPEFIKRVTFAKKNWDSYLNNECLAEAYIYQKESYAYYTAYNLCLVKNYQQRIEYYKKYSY